MIYFATSGELVNSIPVQTKETECSLQDIKGYAFHNGGLLPLVFPASLLPGDVVFYGLYNPTWRKRRYFKLEVVNRRKCGTSN